MPADVLLLTTGAGIPADCRVLEERDLSLDEAALTGKSFPVSKHPIAVAVDAPLAQRSNVLFLGTHVVSGTGVALVVHTGRSTAFGEIAERLRSCSAETEFERGVRRFGMLLKDVGAGGAGFAAQWDPHFVHPIRQAVITPQDENRSLGSIRDAILYRYNDDAFQRVIYSESHDDVANGQARIPQEVNPSDPTGWFAQKRSTMAAAMVFIAPGIPMLFQGQEFLEGAWFRDNVPVDWDQRDEFRGIVRMYRDLIRLRLNREGVSRGLCGQYTQVYHLHGERNVLALHRWDKGGAADDVVVIANFFHEPQDGYVLGFPANGIWRLRFNSDWHGYSEIFEGHPSGDAEAVPGSYDGLPFHATVSIAPYSVLIYSQ